MARMRAAGVLAGVALLYGAVAKLALEFASVHPSASPVWPPAGIALAAALLFGRSVWPAIFVGAFVVNATTAGSIASSLGIAVGNTAEALVGAWLVERYANGRRAFERTSDIFRFAASTTVASTIAATVGVVSLASTGFAPWGRFGSIWLTWWLGDLSGILVVAPLLLLWVAPGSTRRLRALGVEAMLLAASVVIVGQVAFGDLLASSARGLPIAFICMPPLLWAAFRFGPRETSAAIFLLAGVAILGTARGEGVFAELPSNESLLMMQAFLATTVVTALPVAALFSEMRDTDRQLRESQDRLRLAMDAGELGTWEWTLASGRVAWSPSLESMHGLEPGDFPGTLDAFHTHVHSDDRDAVERAFTDALITGELRVTYHIVRTDGALRWMEARGELLIEEGQPRQMVGVCVDVTARKSDEESRARLAAIVEASDDAIVSKALDGTIRSWNPGAARIFGWTAAEAVGRSIDLIIPPELRDEERQILARLRRGERVEHFESVRVTRDGRRVAMSLAISPLFDEQGRVIGASKVGRDITDRKRSEQALREADRRKDEFVATLAHELRGPLAPLRHWLEVLERNEGDPSLRDAARASMRRQLDHMVRLVDDLLDMSRITRGRFELRIQRVDLRPIVRQTVEACRRVVERDQMLDLLLPDDPVPLDADPVRLTQVIANLLDNASKYTPRRGKIQIAVARRGELVWITVKDSGIGIPQDELEQIFEMFEQVDRSWDQSQGGLGIGLTLTKHLVERHGGRIEVHSDGLDQGSEFRVALPAAVGDADVDAVDAAPRVAAQAGPHRILVVDDSRDSADSLAMLLRAIGHDAQSAYDGWSALDAVERWQPHLVLLDLGLPVLDGFEICRRMRAGRWGEHVRIAALTGWGQESDRRRTSEAGFDVHLVKPVSQEELLALLAEIPAD